MSIHRLPARPTLTAAEKLLMLGCYSACRLMVAHFKLREIKGDIDPDALRSAINELSDICWEAERKRA